MGSRDPAGILPLLLAGGELSYGLQLVTKFDGALMRGTVFTRPQPHAGEGPARYAELHECAPEKQLIRLHDLRVTFVTLALAAGRSETWGRRIAPITTPASGATCRRPARGNGPQLR
jgi:hypothetical protein